MKKNSKLLSKTLVILYIVSMLSLVISNNVQALTPNKSPAADGVVLMDAVTGEVLYSKNMNTPYPPASTTKIMTALLTLENCRLDDMVTISKNAEFTEGSKIYVYNNEQISVKDLLYALMLSSANDSAVALAEHISGSVEDFATLMNNRAVELGCKNTNFVNPNGLYNNKHRTSAYDLALIMRELIKHPEYRKIASTISYTIQPTNKSSEVRNLWNGNRLINKNEQPYYENLEAAKTGYTIDSLHSYVASASKNNHRLILALVHDGQKNFYRDTINMFEFGFNNFNLVKLYSKGEKVDTYTIPNTKESIPLLAGDDFYIVKENNSGDISSPKYDEIDLNKTYNKNDYITNAVISNNNKEYVIPLIAGCDYNSKDGVSGILPVFKTLQTQNTTNSSPEEIAISKTNDDTPNKLPFILLIILIILLIILVRIKQVRARKRRRKKAKYNNKQYSKTTRNTSNTININSVKKQKPYERSNRKNSFDNNKKLY